MRAETTFKFLGRATFREYGLGEGILNVQFFDHCKAKPVSGDKSNGLVS